MKIDAGTNIETIDWSSSSLVQEMKYSKSLAKLVPLELLRRKNTSFNVYSNTRNFNSVLMKSNSCAKFGTVDDPKDFYANNNLKFNVIGVTVKKRSKSISRKGQLTEDKKIIPSTNKITHSLKKSSSEVYIKKPAIFRKLPWRYHANSCSIDIGKKQSLEIPKRSKLIVINKRYKNHIIKRDHIKSSIKRIIKPQKLIQTIDPQKIFSSKCLAKSLGIREEDLPYRLGIAAKNYYDRFSYKRYIPWKKYKY